MQPRKRNCIAFERLHLLKPSLRGKPIVGDDYAIIMRSKHSTYISNLLLSRDVKIGRGSYLLFGRLNDLYKPYVPFFEFLEKMRVCFHRVFIEHIVEPTSGTDFDTYLIGLKVFKGDVYEL